MKNKPNAKLIKAREAKGWTQCQLSRRLMLDPTMVSRWERGVFMPASWNRVRLAKALGTTVENLFGE